MCVYMVAYENSPETASADRQSLDNRFQSSCLHIYPGLCLIMSSSAYYVKEEVLQALGRRGCMVAKVSADYDYALPPQRSFLADSDLELLLPPRDSHTS